MVKPGVRGRRTGASRVATSRTVTALIAVAMAASVCSANAVGQQTPPGGQRPGLGPPVPPTLDSLTNGGWIVRPSAHASLWFHALAVIAADQPGPLGLYSADYARHIRDVKQQAGVYPTALDSVATQLREDIGDGRDLETLHFAPLYFPQAEPERMLDALRAVAKRKLEGPQVAGRDVRFGIAVMSQTMQSGKARRILGTLVDVVEQEWDVFYRQYWEDLAPQRDFLSQAVQAMWNSEIVPGLGPYLARRRLTAGLVMPSPALGPEGRIVDLEALDAGDQVVAVQQPILSDGPNETVFAFLKELCFLIVDDALLSADSLSVEEREDLQRTAAVRCGSTLLEFYAPQQVSLYRRAFLDAVGAEESATVAAFERVYYMDPAVATRLHEQVRNP